MPAPARYRTTRIGVALTALILVAGFLTLLQRGDDPTPTNATGATVTNPATTTDVHDHGTDRGHAASAPDPETDDTTLPRAASAPAADDTLRGRRDATDPRPSPIAADVHPANQRQTTLVAAASQASGQGVGRPAAGITGDADHTRSPVDPGDVLSPTAARGGCNPGYGNGGQCLPTRPPSADGATASNTWTCAAVRDIFPTGIATTSDPLTSTPTATALPVGRRSDRESARTGHRCRPRDDARCHERTPAASSLSSRRTWGVSSTSNTSAMTSLQPWMK